MKKTDIEPLVIEAIKKVVSEENFGRAIQAQIGEIHSDDSIKKELVNYRNKLEEIKQNKARLERDIDGLPLDVKFRDRKIKDMNARLDGLYEDMAEIEWLIEEANVRKQALQERAITLDNIYKILLHFSDFFDIISAEERKEVLYYLVKEIHLNLNGENKSPLKSIVFNFPIYANGQEVREMLFEANPQVETLVCLARKAD